MAVWMFFVGFLAGYPDSYDHHYGAEHIGRRVNRIADHRPEWAKIPAKSLNADSITFATMLTNETFIAIFSKSLFIKYPAFLK